MADPKCGAPPAPGCARARGKVPQTRDELLALATEVYDSAMEHTYERDGRVEANPNHSAAIKAIETMGRLMGMLGDGKQMTPVQVRQELARMGYDLVARKPELVPPKKAGNG